MSFWEIWFNLAKKKKKQKSKFGKCLKLPKLA